MNHSCATNTASFAAPAWVLWLVVIYLGVISILDAILLESNTASTLFVRLQWDWGESMQARVMERVTYMKTVGGECDCGCNTFTKAWTDAVGRVPCEPVPDCNW